MIREIVPLTRARQRATEGICFAVMMQSSVSCSQPAGAGNQRKATCVSSAVVFRQGPL